MDPITAAMIASAGIQIIGGISANRAQRKAERANAAYLREQAEMARREKRRALDIYKTESDAFIGNKLSLISKSGVNLSGSLLMQVAGDYAKQTREMSAIAAESDAKARLAELRAGWADKTAKTLGSFQYNILQSGSTALNTYAMYAQFSKTKTNTVPSGITPDGGYSGPILDAGYKEPFAGGRANA